MRGESFVMNRNTMFVLVLGLLTFAAYARSLGNGFVWDDFSIIVNNPLLDEARDLPKLIFSEDASPGEKTGYFRPLTYLTFFMDRAIWGLNPVGYHLVNLILHICVTLAWYSLVSFIFKNDLLAFLSALLFALHPVNSETVNFLSGGRNTILAALFMLGSFLTYVKGKRVLSVLCFGLSIFSKEFGLLLPIMLIVYDRFLRTDPHLETRKNIIRDYLPYFVTIMVYLAVRSFVVGGSGIEFTPEYLLNRIMLFPVLMIRYFGLMLLPYGIKTLHLIVPPKSLTVGVALSTLALASLFMFLPIARRTGAVFFGSIWTFAFLLPVSNIIPFSDILMADRYAYFSSMGFSLILSFLLLKVDIRSVKILVPLLCAFYFIVVISRTPVWKDEHTLYSRMISDSPGATIGYMNLGTYLYSRNRLSEAQEAFEKATGSFPRSPSAFSALGSIYWELGRQDDAIRVLREAEALNSHDFKTFAILSRIYGEKGDTASEASYMAKAESLMPNVELVLSRKALLSCEEAETLQADNRTDEAQKLFRRALRYKPDLARALIGYGSIIAQKGNIDEAMDYFRRASELEPDNPLPHYNLSLCFRLKGRIREAEDSMAQYLQLQKQAGK